MAGEEACGAVDGWRMRYTGDCGGWATGTPPKWRGVGPGAVTVAASLAAWLPGPAAIALSAVALSVPVWLAWYWLVRRG